ncbi:hypothetical protein EYF80_045965 [Liparis tanakae]|uniref:Uncharacterized protein n=1 Tax=Liparis tanakae TaxID=230148 RepID=A0A4Z2FSZ3_9TELE|nr:hypothetical protein EYF80_045965 [Liparis tanakae]
MASGSSGRRPRGSREVVNVSRRVFTFKSLGSLVLRLAPIGSSYVGGAKESLFSISARFLSVFSALRQGQVHATGTS